MTSKITIEVDLDSGSPYIAVKTDAQSDDVRDKLVNHFRQKLGHLSSWCSVRFDDTAVSGRKMFEIHPITPSAIEGQMDIMRSRIEDSLPKKSKGISIGEVTVQDVTDKNYAYYQFHSTKSLKGLREGVLREAIENVINNPDNWVE